MNGGADEVASQEPDLRRPARIRLEIAGNLRA
jgi:hypothetical protein